jgi:hypothetical protein
MVALLTPPILTVDRFEAPAADPDGGGASADQ